MAKISKFLIYISLIGIVSLPSTGLSYILPSTQIIELMTHRFAHIETLKIIQYTKLVDLSGEMEKVFGEIVYLKSPYLFRSEVVGQPGKRIIIHNSARTLRIIDSSIDYDGETQDILYRFFLLAQRPERLLERLILTGVNLEKVSLTRFEGRIAYLIGDKEEWNPRLLVDKHLFFPLLLQYGNVMFRFSDYRRITERTWYPYKIVYSSNEAIVEEYTIKDITVNPPLDVSLFDIPLIRAQFGVSGVSPDEPEPKIRGPQYEIRNNLE
ncbi:MAG: hypothetical protein JSW35_09520 [Deltaproteobacteria bacterium]|nr:MAG: hypothetical protein JSW35_09520 [Deltaproteobacteria bacterium]